jgi:hypothetical protein
VDGGGHAAPQRGGARRQRPETGSRRSRSHGCWCRWFLGNDWGLRRSFRGAWLTWLVPSRPPLIRWFWWA